MPSSEPDSIGIADSIFKPENNTKINSPLGRQFSSSELDSIKVNHFPDSLEKYELESKTFIFEESQLVVQTDSFRIFENKFGIQGSDIQYIDYELIKPEFYDLIEEEDIAVDFMGYTSHFLVDKEKKELVNIFPFGSRAGYLNWSLDYVISISNGMFWIGVHKTCGNCSTFSTHELLLSL